MNTSNQPETDGALETRSRLAAGWALAYAVYRGYYAVGGTAGMFGTPVSESQWRLINAVATVILLVAAVLPIALLSVWRRAGAKTPLFALCWLVTVACVVHALVDSIQRVLSLAGILTMKFPFWLSIDRRRSDWQDLLFNEPWFLIEGLLWLAIAWVGGLRQSSHRRWWLGSAVAAIVVGVVIGVLTSLGVIGSVIIG